MACGPPDNPGETEGGCQAWLTRAEAARRAEWSWSAGDEVSNPNDGWLGPLFASEKLASGKEISREQLEFTLNLSTCRTEQGAPACPVWCRMGYSSQSRRDTPEQPCSPAQPACGENSRHPGKAPSHPLAHTHQLKAAHVRGAGAGPPLWDRSVSRAWGVAHPLF